MDVEVAVEATTVLSYAMAHNRVPVIGKVELRSSVNADAAQVRIEIVDDEGPVTHEFVHAADLTAGATTLLSEPTVRLNPAALLQVRDRRPALIRVSVIHDGETLGLQEIQATLLSGTHWLSLPPGLAFELLPAFVMPNDPAISKLLDEASVLLERATGSPSMEGYQSGPDRVDAIARSIWQATQAREIRYAEPAASWSEIGQKIRTPADVLEGKVGTCLDLTVVLAAALEQAGVRPLLWVIKGHAFLGYWRDESALDAISYPDASEVMNDIDLDRMRLVEATAVTKAETLVDFDATHGLALRHIRGDLDIVQAIVDVWAARHVGVVPLPVRRAASDGSIQVVEYQAAAQGARALVFERSSEVQSAPGTPAAPPRVQQWKNSLLDLSLRNRLINYTDRAGVKLRVPEGRLGELEDLVSGGRPIALRPLDQIEEVDRARGVRSAVDLSDDRVTAQLLDKQAVFTDVLSGGYMTRMRGLAYKARTIQEETGANNLYLTLGSLSWSLDGKQLRSPLILVPVRLTTTARGQLYRLELDESGGSTPNYCLLEKLRQIHGLVIPKLAEPEQDLSGVDLDAALHATRVALATKGLPFHVQDTADLSILQFAKFRLWKDLDQHWQSLMTNSLVRHLVETATDPYEDPVASADGAVDLDALDATCPVPADASQLAAVADATAGRTFVLEGPPGTGKSQTITNLLTRAVAEGKRVLFVAEKRAALDVVSSRLQSVGMGPFSLDLHDKASKPAMVRAQIKQALDHAVMVDAQGLAAKEEDLRSSRRTLARYAERLHEKNTAGLSYYSARTALLTLGEDRDMLDVPASVLSNTESLDNVRRALATLPDTADLAHPAPDHPWGFVDLNALDESTVPSVRAACQAVDEAINLLPGQGLLNDVVRAARTVEDLTTLSGIVGTRVSLEVLDSTRTDAWRAAGASLSGEIGAFLAAAHPGLDVATPAALDLPLADIHAQAQAAEASGFFGKGKRRKAVLALVQPALRPEAKVSHRRILELTTALVQVQGAVRGLAARAGGVSGVSVPENWNPFTDAGRDLVRRQMDWLSWAGAAVDAANPQTFTAAVRDWLRSGQSASASESTAATSLTQSIQELARATQASPASMTRWSAEAGLVARWIQTAGRRTADPELLSLRRWVAFTSAIVPLREVGLITAADMLANGAVHADDAVRAFDRGVAAASITERRQATGLDGFDPLAHDRVVHRFTESAVAVRRHMSTAVPAQVIDSRPFQASTGRGLVGELQRELAKQRRGLGVRALMEKYGTLITQVMPCVLVSPDSVSRFFPVGSQTFDLVVFDEASQIRVADAVGAMGRATSVVVVGDSKQMPPTSFAEPSTGSDDLDTPDTSVLEDEESILTEAITARVPQRWLTWHYRSQDESLIAFSNQHYYENKLSSFPAPTHSVADRLTAGHGISLVRVNGTFNRSGAGKLLRTNPVEADAIFQEIRRRFQASPDEFPSLGVVTFNQQQRAYIEALVRDSQDERLVEALDGTNGEGLFIKNLENVQGDERDVILFSTAFSVNDKGVLPLNFGPLTRAGGERRLNVAVTRARQQVVLFSSFEPAQLRVEQTQSVGIRHLRAYLELAAHGTAILEQTGARTAVPDRHRDEVAAALRERGSVVATDVGLSDFRVDLTLASSKNPEIPLVAVLLDGPGWAARRTVGDRDGLPVEVLERLMGWPRVERVWMPAWLSDPAAVLAGLETALKEAEQKPAAESRLRAEPDPTPPPQAPPPLSTKPSGEGAQPLAGEIPFVCFQPRHRGGRGVLDSLPDRWSAQQVREVISDVLCTEGPIHVERLARLVAACFDLTRLNQARIDSIVRQVPSELLVDPDEPFAWPTGLLPGTWTQFRSGGDRALEHVSLREIGNAMVALCRDAAGMSPDELATETLAVFGGKRKTPGIGARLDAARDVALANGLLRLLGGRLEAAM